MSTDPAVLGALESQVTALAAAGDGSEIPLRLHLAELYLSAGQAQLALEHARKAIESRPADPVALSVAGAAAHALGQDELAESYRELQAGLLDNEPPPRADDAPPRPETAAGAPDRQPVTGASGWPTEDGHRVTLAEVAGMVEVKARLNRSFLSPMANPGLREAFGKSLRGGLLLWGPPGCGKTFIARALSGELGASFLSATPASIYDAYFGDSENNIARLFRQARESVPSVVFLDELDALGGRRSARNTDQARGVVQQLLLEMDGMTSNDGVFMLAATNAPWAVDDALRRPGRFDRTVLVLPPDGPARAALLTASLSGRPVAAGVTLERVVARTETYSGADLEALITAAAERALDRSIEAGSLSPISEADLDAALADSASSTRSWFTTAAFAVSDDNGEDYRALRTYLRAHRIS